MRKWMKSGLIFSLILTMVLSLTACTTTVKQSEEYIQAAKVLETMEPKLDGSHEMTGEILAALDAVQFEAPKSIIFMIGDGMGFQIVEAAQAACKDRLYEGTLAMNRLPVRRMQATYSTSAQITDSAAGATALATGYKTKNKAVSVNSFPGDNYKTVLEIAAEQGKSTGVVATKAVVDATPAAYTAHVARRDMYQEIAEQQLAKLTDQSLDLVLGGGLGFYESKMNAEALEKAKKAGVTLATDWEQASTAKLPLAGLFADELMDTTDESLPTLAQMTDLAIDRLSQNKKGFFLMVEGSQIDTYGEKNEFEREVKELYDFDCAVAIAMRYVALNPDTVLIVTADHETGGIQLPSETTPDNVGEITYTTGGHTYKNVPVLAAGWRTEGLSVTNDNADVGIFVASLLGVEDFGATSTMTSLIEGEAVFAHDAEKARMNIPLAELSDKLSAVENPRVLYVTVQNPGDGRAKLPDLVIRNPLETIVEPHVDYMDGGQTMIVSYVLPTELWIKKNFEKVLTMDFVTGEGQENLVYSDLMIKERPAGK